MLLNDVLGYTSGAAGFNCNNDSFHVNGNNNLNNHGRSRGMTLSIQDNFSMKTYRNLYQRVCSYDNLILAWKKARKRKTLKPYVIDFEKELRNNLLALQTELLLHAYRPKPLNTFTLRDPKTRKISVSDFRDRIVHHALCNIIDPIFDKNFIYDSYANRKGKGTLAAIKRLKAFQRKISRNKTIIKKFRSNCYRGFFLKGDIKHYFDTISHEKMIEILKRKIKDKELLFLIRNILSNHSAKEKGKGMPLGNLTSQFLANVYLNELDQFVKQDLNVKYYIRYVDDFVLLHQDKNKLYFYIDAISQFLESNLLITLNTDKSKIKPLARGIEFLGFRTFYYHQILRRRSARRTYHQLCLLERDYGSSIINYDAIYDFLEGWVAYARNANTYKWRGRMLKSIEQQFPDEISTKEINRYLTEAKSHTPSTFIPIHH